MSRAALRRAGAWLAGVWAGVMAGIGFVAAPALFATLPRGEAGAVANRLFAIDAYLALAFGIVILLLAMRRDRHHDADRHAQERRSVLSADVLLALGAVFCVVAGYFAVQPMMESARAGQATLSFGALHAVSTVFFGLRLLLVASLAWRLSGA